MKQFLFDTNILIYYFADAIPDSEIAPIEEILKNSFYLSIITNFFA